MCEHIIGLEDCDCFSCGGHSLVYEDYKHLKYPPKDEFIWFFQYCPLCGEELLEPKETYEV